MKNSLLDELLLCFKEERPAVLFLGQDAWGALQQNDPILITLLERLGRTDEVKQGWPAILSNTGLNDNDMEWIAERYHRYVPSDAMQSLLDLAWSAVFTTSIDPKLTRRLETRGRQPEAVLSKDHFARVPRSRFRPPIYHLFGRCNETLPTLKAPQSKLELRQRITVHANNMINRVAETVTPLGVLVVDGYSPKRDWLEIDEFLAPLSVSKGLRILWFGATASMESDFFSDLVEKEIIIPYPRRLVDELVELQARGEIDNIGSISSDNPGIISINDNNFFDPSPSIRLRVEASSAIIDDEWTNNVTEQDHVATEFAFNRFHGDFGGVRSLVEGIARGFAIKRDFEQKLLELVEHALRDQGNLSRFIILHGQSGTGKTVAMARLAYDLRMKLKVPVLFAVGRIPQATDVDEFCAEAERSGALGTVILCDSNQTINRYRDLSNALRSRGRRITIVGTTYNTEVNHATDSVQSVEAPSEISKSERDALISLVEINCNDIKRVDLPSIGNAHVLALLYRILTSGRERIVTGISGEARTTEELLRHRASKMPMIARFRSDLAEQLIAAGLHDGNIKLFEEDENGAVHGFDSAAKLIDYVMAAGRVGCSIPVNLLIRTLSIHQDDLDIAQISQLFWGIDLFRWHSADVEGNVLLIGPRIQLEAELICRRRLADKNKELRCLLDLIESIRPFDVDRSSEISFLLDLLHKLERSGTRGDEYCDGYLEIARTLTRLRVEQKIEDASLMLQESAFRRYSLQHINRFSDASDMISEHTRNNILNEAREVVEIAIRGIERGQLRAGRRTKLNLKVERASIYGFLAVERAKAHAPKEAIWSDYLAARTAIMNAVALDDSYIPLDVGLWTPIDILESCNLDIVERAEMAADVYAVMDQVELNHLSQSQKEYFQRRRMKISRVLGDEALGEDAFEQLRKINPPIAYYLRARELASESLKEDHGPLSLQVRGKAKIAAEFLNEKLPEITLDARCLNLLLQLNWITFTGDKLLRGERRPIPNDYRGCVKLRDIVNLLNRVSGDGARSIYRFLEATLEWMTGDIRRATEVWRALERDTEYEDPSRMVRRLYIAGVDGKPIVYRGRVERQRGESKWSVQVEGMSGNIDLFGRDFKSEDLQVGREIRDFAISFNYLGPIADPASRFGGRL